MEKKSGRSVQPLSKGLNFDKKNQDNNNGKQWAKGANRREPPGGSLSAKPETNRKSKNTQRFKSFDKRPKPRSRSDVMARNEASSLEQESQAELGSVFLPGSKKQNLNHLLNFTYAPRREVYSYNKSGNRVSIFKHKYVKEHFLQANCQFIVNSQGDYKRYLNDPDALVDWNYIEQINVQVTDSPSCPICLHPPLAAKITRCGHIYCWCCILHYLSLSDKPHDKCPICYETIHKEDLKSVVIITFNAFNVGDFITFKLMKRNEKMLTPFAADEEIPNEHSYIAHYSETNSSKIHSKLLLAQNTDIISTIIKREIDELQFQQESEEDSEQSFIEEALILLKERETRILDDMMRECNLNKSWSNESGDEGCSGSSAKLTLESSKERHEPKWVYFYQADDGQHIYIHSVNARMLKHSYGSLEFAPKLITAKIISRESDTMNEDYRKCYKYLAHLPVKCPFETVEVELNHPTVSEETMEFFKDELEKRKKQRDKKAKEERKREKRITREENIKIYNKYPVVNIPLESHQQFPKFGPSEISEEIVGSSSTFSDSGPSFAKMASSAKVVHNPWPDLKSSAAVSLTPHSGKMKELSVISGRRRFASENIVKPSEELQDSDHECFQSSVSFGDAIVQALQKAAKCDRAEPSFSGDNAKKKKKKTKKVLLSTTLGYSGN